MKEAITLLRNIRANYVRELNQLTLDELNYIPPTHNNNIIWNIGHSLVVQQLLCYKFSNLDTYLTDPILAKYARGTAPTANVPKIEVDLIRKMLIKSVDLLEKDMAAQRFQVYKEYTVGFGAHLTSITEAITFNNVHESLHYGYLMALKKLL
ncbi:DinB family protein [Aureispira anguillae]|uniref:DinB family protein n=1 Tax=Aureispira anguillae TaxID=2864201 RepID=A0A916DVH8_9BACT|nr:DinB family protein [Aureispira anguillae]BDS13585.1 DinB family protein [Aureispira anguillae]